jgi:hypothetical protein
VRKCVHAARRRYSWRSPRVGRVDAPCIVGRRGQRLDRRVDPAVPVRALMPRMRRILPAAARTPRCGGGTRPQVNASANPCDGSIRTGTQEMAEPGRFAAPGSARNGAIRRGARPPARPGAPPRLLQLPHRGGEIVDQEPTTGLVEKCSWSWSARAEHLEGASLGELEGGEVGLLLAGGQAEDRLEECPQGRVLACPGAYPTNALDPRPCRSPLRSLASAILPRRSWLS